MNRSKSKVLSKIKFDFEPLSQFDTHLFQEGNHFRLYEKMGAHYVHTDKSEGTHFAVWAPNAAEVSVIGDFNSWKPGENPLGKQWSESGIWEGFIPNLCPGQLYKYHIRSQHNGYCVEKQDPFAFQNENPPCSASRVCSLDYKWNDQEWMTTRAKHNSLDAPWSIYEVHLGSWRRKPEENNRWLTYREIAPLLSEYVKKMGFTHVELLPVMEHPFYGSWGYQITGFFAPTTRYGTPQDFMYLIDHLHQEGIGVILDWVPSHFACDQYALSFFDGTHLFEHADPRQGYHPDWGSYIFNYGRNEVRSFLISNAFFWLDKYHIDGIRIDAVASMLYLDYSRKESEWVPNHQGGKENLEAIYFLKRLNEEVYKTYPDVQTTAEESTSFAKVSKPINEGGLGFGFKWNMGWMNDTLRYFSKNSIYRKHHHNDLTFSQLYAFTENFMLPFSHDEVVHGKGSILQKMSGNNDWEKFSNLRLLLGYMFLHPGHKLLFMGTEFGQWEEWKHDTSIDWHQLEHNPHFQISRWVQDLNRTYRNEVALHNNFSWEGFYWIDFNDWESSIITFARVSKNTKEHIVASFNFTPIPRHQYTIGVPFDGYWKEVLNSDGWEYGGSGQGNWGGLYANHHGAHHQPNCLTINLPPLGMVAFKKQLE
jgi:1,4-alpha-glucan branching enzyme